MTLITNKTIRKQLKVPLSTIRELNNLRELLIFKGVFSVACTAIMKVILWTVLFLLLTDWSGLRIPLFTVNDYSSLFTKVGVTFSLTCLNHQKGANKDMHYCLFNFSNEDTFFKWIVIAWYNNCNQIIVVNMIGCLFLTSV